MEQKIFLNGEFVSKKEARISVYDHGLLYGDGVFEGLRSYNGRIFKLQEHMDRLYKSAKYICLDIPLKKEKLIETVIKTAHLNGYTDCYIRVVVTRGEGDLGLDPDKCSNPTIFIIVDKIVLYPDKFYKEGMEVITVPTQRNASHNLEPQVKSLNYLNNILAKIEAKNAGFEEAIMLNREGFITECTGDNIFIIEGNVLKTPPAYMGFLGGITRKVVMEIAEKLSIGVREEVISRYNLFNAQECFLTGTAAEIIPIVKVDGRIIGDGKIGNVTNKIRTAFKKLIEKEGTPYL
ncbi:MAG: branched-chain-amino-acid transaminase [Candidatus Ratteibacteria bacterium]|nr:branched-chain-amino-acid transaminase [Candidatus Ratteibacteria bacterium]